ncbi:hypothetical protein [Metabacillus sediminilitoris]|nr:hypothetical protein [Metabacillus sediminilitoris]
MGQIAKKDGENDIEEGIIVAGAASDESEENNTGDNQTAYEGQR